MESHGAGPESSCVLADAHEKPHMEKTRAKLPLRVAKRSVLRRATSYGTKINVSKAVVRMLLVASSIGRQVSIYSRVSWEWPSVARTSA